MSWQDFMLKGEYLWYLWATFGDVSVVGSWECSVVALLVITVCGYARIDTEG